MIKIIKGTYGLKRDGAVEAMTPRSAPFSLPAAREAALVRAGVAEYVPDDTKPDERTNYDDMKMAELRKAAEALGLDTSGAKTRRAVIAMLEGVQPEPAATDP